MERCRICGRQLKGLDYCGKGALCKECICVQHSARKLYESSQAKRIRDHEDFKTRVKNFSDHFLLIKCGERFTEDFEEVKRNERLVKKYEQAGCVYPGRA